MKNFHNIFILIAFCVTLSTFGKVQSQVIKKHNDQIDSSAVFEKAKLDQKATLSGYLNIENWWIFQWLFGNERDQISVKSFTESPKDIPSPTRISEVSLDSETLDRLKPKPKPDDEKSAHKSLPTSDEIKETMAKPVKQVKRKHGPKPTPTPMKEVGISETTQPLQFSAQFAPTIFSVKFAPSSFRY